MTPAGRLPALGGLRIPAQESSSCAASVRAPEIPCGFRARSVRVITERTAANAKVRFPLTQSIWARVTEVGSGEGFRMPARRDYSRALRGPASESLPGRNPRAAVWAGDIYGDLTERRFG